MIVAHRHHHCLSSTRILEHLSNRPSVSNGRIEVKPRKNTLTHHEKYVVSDLRSCTEVSHESYVPQELRGREGTRWWRRRRTRWRRTRGGPACSGHHHLRDQRGLVRPDRDAFRRGARRYRPVSGQRGAWTRTTQPGIWILSVDGRSRAPGTWLSYSLVPVAARRWNTRLTARGVGRATGSASQLGPPCD